jgi:protease-4
MLRRFVFAFSLLALGAPAMAADTVAVFKLSGAVNESPASVDIFSFSPPGPSLSDIVKRIEKSATDADVKAVVLMSEGAAVGRAQIEEIRQAMAKVRAAGKEIYVHSDSFGMGEYALFSGASRVSVVPTGSVDLYGMHGEAMYFRGLLDLVGVKPDYLTCGAYKSAAEQFMLKGPSKESEEMQNWLLDSLYESTVAQIAEGRKVDAAKVKDWIDNGPYTAEEAKEKGIIDAIEHRQDFEKQLKEKFGDKIAFDSGYGKDKPKKLDMSSPFAMMSIWAEIINGPASKPKSKADTIAIVHVEGAIVLGNEGGINPLTSGGAQAVASKIRKALDEAAADDTVKAVVLRVNSPGGSAIASEIILDATKRVKAKKPIIVSMGDVAGSGGYYVACAADTVYADPSTITGSIGVVGGKFATSEMFKKVGITFKSYSRGKNAELLSSERPWNEAERAKMQSHMDAIYNVFKGHVTAIRESKLKKPIDELAGGRVFTGKQALELGLVDKLGSLKDAIAHAASEAKLEKYEVRTIPEAKNFLDALIADLAGDDDEDTSHISMEKIRGKVLGGSLIDVAAPYLQQVDPARATLVREALGNMEWIQREGVLLMTPMVVK